MDYSGRLSRRKVLQLLGLGGVGISSAALLAACSDASNSVLQPVSPSVNPNQNKATSGPVRTQAPRPTASGQVKFVATRDVTGTVQQLVDSFNQQKNGITVVYQELDDATSSYTTSFASKDSSLDIIAVPMTTLPHFASVGWLAPLDNYATADIQDQFFAGTMQGATYKKQLYGVPWYNNVGLLYYRKDLLDAAGIQPPTTYDDLVAAATRLQRPTLGLYGFIEDGYPVEGLAADWLETLWGFGGDFWNADSNEVTVNSSAGLQALQWWSDNITTRKISPQQMISWRLNDIRTVFNQGNAVFMRDWADGYTGTQDATSRVVGKVGVKALVAAAGQAPAGNLDSGYLAVSAFSKNPAAAWYFLEYMTTGDGAKARALGTGQLPPVKALYQDKDILDRYAITGSVLDALTTARPRPATPAYNQISAEAIQAQVASVLSGKTDPKAALQAMSDRATAILANFK